MSEKDPIKPATNSRKASGQKNAARQVTLSQDWTIKPGVIIPAHTTVGVAPVYYEQLQVAGMVAEPKAKSKQQTAKNA